MLLVLFLIGAFLWIAWLISEVQRARREHHQTRNGPSNIPGGADLSVFPTAFPDSHSSGGHEGGGHFGGFDGGGHGGDGGGGGH